MLLGNASIICCEWHTKADYNNHVRTIVDTYPKLKGGKESYVSVRWQILFIMEFLIYVIIVN